MEMILITVGMVSFRRLMPELVISSSLPFFQLMPVFFFQANKLTEQKKS